ncbi:maleylpyruvate isomerase family mycothiol-dependent enzyme [Sinomonas sp. ASV486]|uniref:maleylpyruvate isomerase family mycothiol-dependent enzyme n=1 Tax=Sinomonas sp. ASV486 TaxID=3051170 RepID=UPI0027DE2011|nr:maleylpyruvate isomerase family mycothiol-dependent enzyme [Sinomonas sp. ASV486]MDQ4489061.1 maleylpyruvate isomerase family mycothiol-dependent enzyme [Sinomonas sp. ASV486]
MPENQNPTSPEAFAEAVDRLESLTRTFAEEIDQAVDEAMLGKPVPTCPGWRLGDLIDHLAGIHRWAAASLGAEHAPAETPRPPDADLVRWYRTSAEHLVEALRAAGPGAPAWTLWGDRVAAFWVRRQVHETAIHTFDLLSSLKLADDWDLEGDVALDGIHEVLFGFYPRQVRLGRTRGLPGVVRFEVTHDGGGSATVLVSPAAEPDSPEAETPLGTVTGPAAEIYLGLWGRRPLPGATAELAAMIRAAKLIP